MKYINFAIVACMAAIALFSCETFNPEDVEEVSKEVVITASVRDDSSDTKSAIDEIANNKVKFTWLAGDAINVFFGASEGSIFVTEATARVAQFKGSITGVTGGGDDLTDETSLWGVYPYDKNTTSDGSSITLTLPHSQDAKEDNLADDLYPSIARSTNFTMAFSPVCGSLRFKVTNSDIVKVTLRGNNGEDLAGKAKISMPLGGKPAVSEILEGQKELVMTAPEGGCFVPGKWYYFVLYPTGFSEGFTLTFYNESGLRGSFVREAAFPVARNMFYSAIDKDAGLTFTKIGYDYIDENGINQGPGIEIDGVMWAPVNCGYHKTDYPYGKLYQWGRKYGVGYENTDGKDAITPGFKYGNLSMLEGQLKENEHIYFTAITTNWTIEKNDGLWNAGTEDAPVKTEYDPCPNGWRVPTLKELNVLSGNSEMVVDELGREGYWFTAQENYSEDAPQIFFPKNGAVWTKSTTPEGYPTFKREDYACYWLSSEGEYSTYSLQFRIDTEDFKPFIGLNYLRANAMGIRCVKDDNEVIPVDKIQLNVQELTLQSGATFQLDASVSPDNANNKRVYWYSKDKHIATVDDEGNVTAHFAGTTTITAIAGYMSSEVSVKVTGRSSDPIDYIDENNVNHGKGVLIGTAIWAPVNCGYHITDYPYGKLYQWGRKYGQGYDENDRIVPGLMKVDDSKLTMTESQSEDYKNVFFYSTSGGWSSPWANTVWNSGTEDAPIKTDYDPCPHGWRVPTKNELESLYPTNYWTAENNGHQEGYYQSYQYEHAPCVGFPAGGFRDGFTGEAYRRNVEGVYWSSSSIGESNNSFMTYLTVIDGQITLLTANLHGLSVRCVQE